MPVVSVAGSEFTVQVASVSYSAQITSGTITQMVPPALVLVVMADQLGQSVGDMYKGAWGPSILQVLFFAVYTFFLGRFLI